MVKYFIGLLLVTAFLTLLSLHGCSSPLVPLIRAKYPDCQLLSYDELGQGYIEAKLQCGPLIKVVKFQDRRE
jgi:hypothetical protein